MTVPFSPKLIKAGLMPVDPTTAKERRVIALRYNQGKLMRILKPTTLGEGAELSAALRLKGAVMETLEIEAEIDTPDQLESPGQQQETVESGIAPQLTVLAYLINPMPAVLRTNQAASRCFSRGSRQ